MKLTKNDLLNFLPLTDYFSFMDYDTNIYILNVEFSNNVSSTFISYDIYIN